MSSAAEPILASSLWLQHIQDQDDLFRSKCRRLPTGFLPIDSIMDGGFDFGSIHSITSDPTNGSLEMIQSLIVSHLTSAPNTAVILINTIPFFDLWRLRNALQASISCPSSFPRPFTATEALNRLQLMQVFDFTGLTESISEIRDSLALDLVFSHTPPLPSTIEDSDADEDVRELHVKPSPLQNVNPSSTTSAVRTLLVIDSISYLFIPVLKNDYAQGQALISATLRSLGELTQRNRLCTIMVGAAAIGSTGLTAASSKTNIPHSGAREEMELSQFEECRMRNALGYGWGYLVDTQIYLHSLSERGEGASQKRDIMKPHIFEVVQDRFGPRAGRWIEFDWDRDGKLKKG